MATSSVCRGLTVVGEPILRSRPSQSAEAYASIWRDDTPGSPLLYHGEALRDAMQALTEQPVELACATASRRSSKASKR